ncbi:hypothetical protein MPER_09783, partial [Moniliophthora perniciosa FA553]
RLCATHTTCPSAFLAAYNGTGVNKSNYFTCSEQPPTGYNHLNLRTFESGSTGFDRTPRGIRIILAAVWAFAPFANPPLSKSEGTDYGL